jgi:hypothetical protein
MDISQIAAWIQAGQLLVAAGTAAVTDIRTWMASKNPGLTEAELNSICDIIITNATAHKRLADLDKAAIVAPLAPVV